MFGLLRDCPFVVFCGTAVSGVWVPSAHIAPFLRVVNARRAFQPVLLKTKREGFMRKILEVSALMAFSSTRAFAQSPPPARTLITRPQRHATMNRARIEFGWG